MTSLSVVQEGEGTAFKFSPSQLATFQDCQRKWVYEKIERIEYERDSEDGTQLGDACHKAWEFWLDHAQSPPEGHVGDICRQTIRYLPKPGTGKSEIHFWLPIPDLGLFNGRIDYFIRNQGQVPREALGETLPPGLDVDGVPLVIDHKTSKSPKRYAKSAEDLLTDPQAVGYATWALIETGAKYVDLLWSYSGTEALGALPVRVRFSRDQLDVPLQEQIISPARLMKELRERGVRAKQVPRNPNACRKYKGCPYIPQCWGSQGESDMSSQLLARLKAAKAASTPVAVVPADAPKPAPVPEPVVQEAPKPAPVVQQAVVQEAPVKLLSAVKAVPELAHVEAEIAEPEASPEPAPEPAKKKPGRPKTTIEPAPEVDLEAEIVRVIKLCLDRGEHKLAHAITGALAYRE